MTSDQHIPGQKGSLRPSRRSIIKAAGATALATSLGFATAGHAAAEDDIAATRDVLIVGAGFAGITAARELRSRFPKLKIQILEARDRIGGRTWTRAFAGEQVELGGTWVDPKQRNIWREVQRYKLELTEDAGPTRAIFPANGGFASFAPEEAFARQAELLTPLFDGSQQYFERPYEPFYREDLLNPIDRMSLRDKLDQLKYSAADEAWVSATTGGYAGSSTTGSLSQLAQWWALSGWNYEGYLSVNTWRPKVGTAGLLKAMLADADATLRLNTPVTQIADDGKRVFVRTAAGQTYTARSVVVAVPANVWNTIKFSSLPSEFGALSTAGTGVRTAKKAVVHVTGKDLGRFYAEAPEGSPISLVVPFSERSDGNIIITFSVDPNLDVNSTAQMQTALRGFVPDLNVVSVLGQNWGGANYSLGGWSFRKPGQLTGPLRTVQRRQGLITFATSDIASGWNGFMDGAIESGSAAAVQTAEALGLA
ncbi:FAD-dependent oxidoreductase [Streptomyces sp. NPDC059165]|uniref:flavin monoamine oxidase family protein n=1 Tax=Streptomyces sp. NPDC059165 TaxID=3346751 RepID=UPI00369B5114